MSDTYKNMKLANEEYLRLRIDKLFGVVPVRQPIILVHATEALAKENFEKIKKELESGVVEFSGKFKIDDTGRTRYWMQRWRHKYGKIDRQRKRKAQKANKKTRTIRQMIDKRIEEDMIDIINNKIADDLKNLFMCGLGNDVTKPSRQMFESAKGFEVVGVDVSAIEESLKRDILKREFYKNWPHLQFIERKAR